MMRDLLLSLTPSHAILPPLSPSFENICWSYRSNDDATTTTITTTSKGNSSRSVLWSFFCTDEGGSGGWWQGARRRDRDRIGKNEVRFCGDGAHRSPRRAAGRLLPRRLPVLRGLLLCSTRRWGCIYCAGSWWRGRRRRGALFRGLCRCYGGAHTRGVSVKRGGGG